MKKTITDFVNDRSSAVLCTLAAHMKWGTVDDKVYTFTSNTKAGVVAQATTTPTVGFGNMATATQAAGAWAAVPEPTSGLLMLLGMAGLALKRKRA